MHDTVFHDNPSKTVGFYFPQPGAMLDRSEDLLNKLSALRASCFLHEAQENRVDDREEVKETAIWVQTEISKQLWDGLSRQCTDVASRSWIRLISNSRLLIKCHHKVQILICPTLWFMTISCSFILYLMLNNTHLHANTLNLSIFFCEHLSVKLTLACSSEPCCAEVRPHSLVKS